MNEREEGPIDQPPVVPPSASEIYALLADLVMHSEETRWSCLNTMLVVDSIFLAAWAGLFAGTKSFAGKESLLALLCTPGIALGVLFACLGWRSSQYLDDFHSQAHRIEEDFPRGLPRPFHRGEQRRRTVRSGLPRLTSSKWLVTAIPVIFAILFLMLFSASFLLEP